MKCQKCKEKNISIANYCKKCGKPFTKEEREYAKKHGLKAVLDTIKRIYEKATFQESIFFQVGSVLLVLAVGLYLLFTMGRNFRLLSSEAYEVNYNEEENTYYVLVDKNEEITKIPLNVYVPNSFDGVVLMHYGEQDNLLEKEEHGRKDEILVSPNVEENTYYILSNLANEEENIKVYVFYKE